MAKLTVTMTVELGDTLISSVSMEGDIATRPLPIGTYITRVANAAVMVIGQVDDQKHVAVSLDDLEDQDDELDYRA